MLCEICSSLDIDLIFPPAGNTRWKGSHPFHAKFGAVQESALQGCGFCILVSNEFRDRYTPDCLERNADTKLFIGLGPKNPNYVAGESELWVGSKGHPGTNGLVIYSFRVFLHACIPRSESEWKTGLP